MEQREGAYSEADGRLWFAPRVERRELRLSSREVLNCATYQIVGGQPEAFAALRSFSDGFEPVAVDLTGLTDVIRAAFLAFLETTGLVPIEWVTADVLVMKAESDDGGPAGDREPRQPRLPVGHDHLEAPITSER